MASCSVEKQNSRLEENNTQKDAAALAQSASEPLGFMTE